MTRMRLSAHMPADHTAASGKPTDSGISLQAVSELGPEFPLFGVCMGHQCIGEAFGGGMPLLLPGVRGRGRASTQLEHQQWLFAFLCVVWMCRGTGPAIAVGCNMQCPFAVVH
jgi:hypothetical protein